MVSGFGVRFLRYHLESNNIYSEILPRRKISMAVVFVSYDIILFMMLLCGRSFMPIPILHICDHVCILCAMQRSAQFGVT